MQLAERWVRSILIVLLVLGSIAALWHDHVETIGLAEVPFGIGAANCIED